MRQMNCLIALTTIGSVAMNAMAASKCEDIVVIARADNQYSIALSSSCRDQGETIDQISDDLEKVIELSEMEPYFLLVGDSLLCFDRFYLSKGRHDPKGIVVIPSWDEPGVYEKLEGYSSPLDVHAPNYFLAVSPTQESHLVRIGDDGALKKYSLPKELRIKKLAVSSAGRWASLAPSGRLAIGELDQQVNAMRIMEEHQDLSVRDLIWLNENLLVLLTKSGLTVRSAKESESVHLPLDDTQFSRLQRIDSKRFALIGSPGQGIFEWDSTVSTLSRFGPLGTRGRIISFLCEGKYAITMKDTGIPGGYRHDIEATSLARRRDSPPEIGELRGAAILGVVQCPGSGGE